MKTPFIVGIAGGSGSGKSWLAQRIRERFAEESCLICHDWYYRDLSHLNVSQAAKTNFDHPDALETELLVEHLDELSHGRTVFAPDYEFSRYTRLPDRRLLEPRPLIVVEGIHALTEPSLRQRYAYSVFVDTPADIRLIRRIRRDLSERGYTLKQILRSWEAHARPMYERYVAPCAEFASVQWKSLVNNAFVDGFLSDLDRRLAHHAANDENERNR